MVRNVAASIAACLHPERIDLHESAATAGIAACRSDSIGSVGPAGQRHNA
jgi:hypothetical protein